MAIARRAILYAKTTSIAAAALQAWNSTPIEIAPAPGANRILQPIGYGGQYKAGTRPFGVTDIDNMGVGFTAYVDTGHTGGGAQWFSNLNSTQLQQTADHIEQGGVPTVHSLSSAIVGGWANADIVNKPLLLAGTNDLLGGAVATVTINAAGLLYAVNDTGHILQGSNAVATYRVSTIGGGGAVTAVVITAAGHDYGVANGLSTDTSGSGSGLKLNITAVNKGNGSLITTVLYGIVQLS